MRDDGEGFERITARTVMVGPSSREMSQIALTISNMDGVLQETLILDGAMGRSDVRVEQDGSMKISIEWRGTRGSIESA